MCGVKTQTTLGSHCHKTSDSADVVNNLSYLVVGNNMNMWHQSLWPGIFTDFKIVEVSNDIINYNSVGE
jgi:hypothetical protein